MRRTKIVLIVLLGGIMLSLCVLLGIGISTGRGFWNGFGVHGGSDVGNKDAGSIDVGRIDVGRSVTGDFSVGDMDDADDMDDMHDVDSQGTDKYFTWNRNYSLVLEKEIPAEDIRSLNINYSMTFNDVIFYQGDGENVLVREYMSFEPEERQISTVEQNGTELAVKGARRNSFSFFYVGFRDAYTEIYLPAELTENLEHVSVKTVSGSVLSQIPLAQTGTFQVSTTSGDVFFPEVRAEKIELSSVSGDIRLALTRTDKTELSTTSGEVRLQEGQGELDASSTSGDIRADSLEGAFRLDTTSGTLSIAKGSGFGKAGSVSGDIRIFLDELQGGLDISTTSGDVSLQLPKTASLSLHFSSTSGECVTFFDEELSFNKKGNKAEGQHGGGEHSIDVSTVSGDLSISEE